MREAQPINAVDQIRPRLALGNLPSLKLAAPALQDTYLSKRFFEAWREIKTTQTVMSRWRRLCGGKWLVLRLLLQALSVVVGDLCRGKLVIRGETTEGRTFAIRFPNKRLAAYEAGLWVPRGATSHDNFPLFASTHD